MFVQALTFGKISYDPTGVMLGLFRYLGEVKSKFVAVVERGLDITYLGRSKNTNGILCQVLPFHTSGTQHYPHSEEREDGTYRSAAELGRLAPSRLVMYSVFVAM